MTLIQQAGGGDLLWPLLVIEQMSPGFISPFLRSCTAAPPGIQNNPPGALADSRCQGLSAGNAVLVKEPQPGLPW